MFGAVLTLFAVKDFKQHARRYPSGRVTVGYELTRFLRPLPPRDLRLVLAADLLACLCVTAGWLLPVSASVLACTRTYDLLIDRSRYNNHYYLVCLLCVLFAVVPTGHVAMAPRWHVLIVQLQVLLVYFFGGIAKLNADWLLRAMPFANHLRARKAVTGTRFEPRNLPFARWTKAFNTMASKPATAFAFCWLGMLFDLAVGPLLLIPETRHYALVPFLCFHLFNHWFYGLGIFPYVNYASAVLFIDPAVLGLQPHGSLPADPLWFFVSYTAIQCLVPLRRYATWAWSRGRIDLAADQCRHFAWTMKLLDVDSHGFKIVIFDRATGATRGTLELGDLMTMRMRMVVATSPRALVLALREMEPRLQAKLGDGVGLRVQMCVSYNGRPKLVIVDPTADLRGQKVFVFRNYPWHNLTSKPRF